MLGYLLKQREGLEEKEPENQKKNISAAEGNRMEQGLGHLGSVSVVLLDKGKRRPELKVPVYSPSSLSTKNQVKTINLCFTLFFLFFLCYYCNRIQET